LRAIENEAPHDIHHGAFGTYKIAPLMREQSDLPKELPPRSWSRVLEYIFV